MKRSLEETQPVVLIIGASFGGLSTALRLARHQTRDNDDNDESEQELLQECRVVMVSSVDYFTIGGLWQFVWNARIDSMDRVKFDLRDALLPSNVDLKLNTTVVNWEPKNKTVQLQDESLLTYDYIVLACGIVTDPSRIPGIDQHLNICTFGTVGRQASEMKAFLQKAVATSGHVTFVLAVGFCPYKCPVAPFEVIFLLEEQLCKAGRVRERCRLVITCPSEWPMPLSTKPQFDKVLEERSIEYLGCYEMEKVNDDSVIYYKNGKTIAADLIWSIHPIHAPEFVRNAIPDKMKDGFVDIEDMATNRIPGMPQSYAIGDCCRVAVNDDLLIPKAGEFAWKMGQSVADDILKRNVPATDRTGQCLAELGFDQGVTVTTNFSDIINQGDAHKIDVEKVERGSEEKKVEWVNSYLRQIFGETKTLSLDMLKQSSKDD